MINKSGTFSVFTIVVLISADNDIAVSITVYIPRSGYGNPNLRTYLVAFYDGSGSTDPSGRTMIDKGGTFNTVVTQTVNLALRGGLTQDS